MADLAKIKMNGVTYNLKDAYVRENYQIEPLTLTVSLTVANWSNLTQTVTATGVTDSNLVQVSPAPTSVEEYGQKGITCITQGNNTLTFICKTIPTNTLTVNVVIWR